MEKELDLMGIVTFLEKVRHQIDERGVHRSEETYSAFKLILDAEHNIQEAATLLNFEY